MSKNVRDGGKCIRVLVGRAGGSTRSPYTIFKPAFIVIRKTLVVELKMDKSMLGDLDSMGEEDKLRMTTMIEQLQIRDSLRMYNSLVERCFNDCIDTFRRKSLDKQEDTCVRRCAEKFLKHSMRVGLRPSIKYHGNQKEKFSA
ncbi:hypothetical protein AMTR_s00012p00203130 [Amborella trichopoda]|uniref:Mitochondrial import inner membrane translocase subunit n=1 Tax=Amborella trichopoda TaxID=13333 RepID=W1PJC6_AMBTC|nr:hypothetical protein AMTR_s00012p00203130 [Amborella trichopoda]